MAKAMSSWAKYCRDNGYKNLGAGRAKVSTGTGYDTKTIELRMDGTIVDDRGDDVKIGPELQKRLQEEYSTIMAEEFPVMPAPSGVKRPKFRDNATIFEYRDKNGNLNMMVERFIKPDGVKQCLPWTYYESDGWRCQDLPDGMLSPLYGNHHGRSRVMIHEGEKAVDAAIAACGATSTHPWADFLRLFGHCTWKGGAIAGMPGKADWSELDECKEVYLMPDNDHEGYTAAQIIRKKLRCESIYCIHWRNFPDQVPKKWDIADECPNIPVEVLQNHFELYEPATFTFYDDDGNPKQKLRPNFAKKFAFIHATKELVELRNPRRYYDQKGFNSSFGDLAPGIKNLYQMMCESPDLVRVSRPGYKPYVTIRDNRFLQPNRLGTTTGGEESIVNMYRPTLLNERDTSLAPKGTVETLRPFLAYMNKTFPIPRERKTIIRWLCHNLTATTPEERALWAVLLVSTTEGTGKSTLGNLVRRLVGAHNVAKVNGALLNDKYTGWLENVQLVLVEELKESGAFKLTESLKDKITEPTIPIRRMNTDPYSSDNHMSLLASSNHLSALSLGRKDRRWFLPKVTEELIPWNKHQAKLYLAMPKDEYDGAFFSALWTWFNNGGDSYLLYLMRRYGLKLHQREWGKLNNRAPLTEQKAKVIERSVMDWESLINEEISHEPMVCLQDLREWLREQNIRPPRAEVIAEYLETIGLPRLFTDSSATSDQVRQGRVYLFKKPSGGWVVGHIHGNVTMDRGRWNYAKQNMNWLSDRYKGLAAQEVRQGSAVTQDTPPAQEQYMTDAF